MATERDMPSVPLSYSIAGCSEHSGRYVAENIMVNNPQDQASRWSGAYQTVNMKQWMLLKLKDLAVIKSITFGKFHKPHPCNMKEFKLYVGLSENSMTEVLHTGLKNDPNSETFGIRCTNQAGLIFPSRYVKIEPLSAHGHSFHTSIWYVQLSGINDEKYVEDIRIKHEEYRETVILGLVMKHLRQRRMLGPYKDLATRTGFQLEHPNISALYDALVLQGNFDLCETLLQSIADASLFSESLLTTQPSTRWTQLHAVDADGDAPSARGGHAMCMDGANGHIYLFGGWDGQKNLDDFWMFDVKKENWVHISYATQRELHGPGPRACHKMVFDTITGDIYIFGRLDEASDASQPHADGTATPLPTPISPPATNSSPVARGSSRTLPTPPWSMHSAEFYRYHTRGPDEGKWELITNDTAAVGGPSLIFDHQMVLHPETQVIYVFGGRVVDGDWEMSRYSGLYGFDIRKNLWTSYAPSDLDNPSSSIPSRFGHSMVLDHITQTLFIFGGQRDDKYLSDMYAFHIPTNCVTVLYTNFTASGGPDACFTQRAVIDPELREIYIFCGLTRRRHGPITILDSESPYWIYRYERPERPGKWIKMLPPDSSSTSSTIEMPVARYAHQVVYDPMAKTTYMHGGNASLEKEMDEDGMMTVPQDGPAGEEDMTDRLVRMHELRARNAAATAAAAARAEADSTKDSRLDDFWKMSLIRPSADDIVRRSRYLLRQQKFRELCEDAPPLKALSYLQADVSAVVDHSDPEEAQTFHTLLSHLLSPPVSGLATSTASSRKRTRDDRDGSSAVPTPSSIMDVPEDDPMTASSSPARVVSPLPSEHFTGSRALISYDEDGSETKAGGVTPPSAARFKRRTEVFEQLMAFVNDNAKQPAGDLAQMINVDQGEE